MKREIEKHAAVWDGYYCAAVIGYLPGNNCAPVKSLARRAAEYADAMFRQRKARFDPEEKFDPSPKTASEDRGDGNDG